MILAEDSNSVLSCEAHRLAVGTLVRATCLSCEGMLAGLAVTWLGTSSGAPTLLRNVSCIAVRLPHSTFLVDAGEGSCRQVRSGC